MEMGKVKTMTIETNNMLDRLTQLHLEDGDVVFIFYNPNTIEDIEEPIKTLTWFSKACKNNIFILLPDVIEIKAVTDIDTARKMLSAYLEKLDSIEQGFVTRSRSEISK